MYVRDVVNVTKNRTNSQISFNIRIKQLKKLGITPQYLLNLKIPKNLSIKPVDSNIIKKEVKSKWT